MEVVVRCKCGERDAFVECGSVDSAVERQLPCNSLCKNLVRFSRFHDRNKITYSALLIRFARFQRDYLMKFEKKIEQFIKASADNEMLVPFEFNQPQRKFAVQCLLAKHYCLDVAYYAHPKLPYFIITKRGNNTTTPKMLLSDYLKRVEKGEIKPDISPFEISLRFLQSNKEDLEFIQLN